MRCQNTKKGSVSKSKYSTYIISCAFSLFISFNITPVVANTTIFQDFENSSSFTDNFTLSINGNPTPPFSHSATNGIGNSGKILISSNTDQLWTTNQKYSMEDNGVYTLSALFHSQYNNGYGSFGFSSASTNDASGTQGSPAAPNIGISFHAGGGSWINTGGTGASLTPITWNTSLDTNTADAEWYFFVLKITDKTGNDFDLEFTVYDVDQTTGAITGTRSGTHTRTITNSNVKSGSDLYVYFGADGQRMVGFDNFTIDLSDNVIVNGIQTGQTSNVISPIEEVVEDIAGNLNGISVTATQLNTIAGVSGADSGINYTAALAAGTYADAANPTPAEIQAVIDSVNSINALASVADTIANNTPITATELNKIIGVSGADSGTNYTAALAAGTYADPANPTPAEIQTIIDSINALASVVDTIANNTPITATELNKIIGVSGADSGTDYTTALAAGIYADPANPTPAEIQTIIDSINALASVADTIENNTPITATELNKITGVSGADSGTDYTTALAAGTYADPANPTLAEIQAVIDSVNSINALASVVDTIENNTPITAIELNKIIGVSGADSGIDYTVALVAGTYADPANPTPAEIQTIIDSINALASVADTIANNTPITATELNKIIGVSGVESGTDYTAALAAGTYADPANPTPAETQAVIDSVNSINALARVAGTIANNTPITATELNKITGVSGADSGTDYTAALAAGTYADPANPTPAEVQAVVNSVNSIQTPTRPTPVVVVDPTLDEDSLKFIAGSEADGQQAVVDLNTDIVENLTLIDHIRATTKLISINKIPVQYLLESQTGLLYGQWNELNAVLRPISVKKVENGEQPGISTTEDGQLQLITENGRKIVSQVEAQAFGELTKTIGEQFGLEIKRDTDNNLSVFQQSSDNLDPEFRYNVRPALITEQVNDDSKKTGIYEYEFSDLPNVTGYYHQFVENEQLNRQYMYSTPVNWNSLKKHLNNFPGVEVVSMNINGEVYARLHGIDYNGRMGAKVSLVDKNQPLLDETYLINMNDTNGDGKDDFKVVYPNGEWQMLYLLE